MTAKRDLLRQLIVQLPATDVVLYPDHPLLFRGPDLLANNDGRLVAYFVSTERFRHTAIAEQSRYLLARFALPPQTLFTLVVDWELELDERGSELFESVLLLSGNATELLRDREAPAATAVEELRMYHYDRFSDAWTASIERVPAQALDRLRRGPSTAEFFSNRRRRPRRVELTPLSHILPLRVDLLPLLEVDTKLPPSGRRHQSRQTEARRLVRVASAAVRDDYALDEGVADLWDVAVMLRTADAHLALYQEEVLYRPGPRTFDAMKPRRAAAFAGVVTSIDQDA